MNYIIIAIILLIIIVSLAKFYKRSQENFNINNLIQHTGLENSGSYVYCLLPKYYNEDGFIGTYLTNSYSDNPKELSNNLIQTYALQNNKWSYRPIDNGDIFYNNKHYVIHDLNWSKDYLDEYSQPYKKLMAVGMIYVDEIKDYEYKIFSKTSQEIDSEWEPLFPNTDIDKNIICIRYDLNNNLIGINKEDYQIYRFKPKSQQNINPNYYGLWKGPINFNSNVLLHKIMFDTDKHLLGIDLDGKIHKKISSDWEQSDWHVVRSKHSQLSTHNSNQLINEGIFDLVHDYDGKLIATTKHGLVKQVTDSWDSDFIIYDEKKNKNVNVKIDSKTISKNTVLMCRTGNDTGKYDYIRDDDAYLGQEEDSQGYSRKKTIDKLNKFLDLKRKLRGICKNHKKNTYKVNELKTDILFDSLDANNNEISSIKNLLNNLTSKGYNF